MNQLPELEEQAKQLLEKGVKPFEFYDAEKKEWTIPNDSPHWKKAVLEKFAWIRQIHSNSAPGEELEPAQYATMSDEDNIEPRDFNNIKNKKDHLRRFINLRNNGHHITTVAKTTIVEDYPASFSWRDLFIKLCFE
jgi:hypothetical protein